MFEKGNQYGKKPRYKTPEEIQEKIDAYFIQCEGTLLRDHNGDPMVDRWGNPIYIDRKPPTITGLALALGFKTRKALQLYKAKKEFTDVILLAKSRIEQYNEEMLFSRDGSKGAQFSLRHNFQGWQDENAEDKGPAVSIINDIPKGVSVNVNTDTAVFNPLQKPEESEEDTENGAE